LLNSTLGCRFSHLLLDIRELDITLRGPLVVIGRREVAVTVDYPVVIGQELLPVDEVGLERIGLLLGVKRVYLLPYDSSSVKAA
jgi:hypothetical protein